MINILKQIDENNIQNPTFIFVDGSYYCFYRYFATIQWWNNAHPEIILEDPYENEIFVEKFKKTFSDNMLTIPKKLKLDKSKSVKPFIIVGKDCKRENIWRMNLFSKYKANRENDSFKGKLFFKMVYEEELFQKEYYSKYGYDTLTIWEDELNDLENIKQKVLNFHFKQCERMKQYYIYDIA